MIAAMMQKEGSDNKSSNSRHYSGNTRDSSDNRSSSDSRGDSDSTESSNNYDVTAEKSTLFPPLSVWILSKAT